MTMPSTVAEAFNLFLTTSINPSPETVTLALATRQRLFVVLEQLITTNPDFPALAPQHLDISPIFRKTQIRPLQQLTLLLLFQAPQLETFPSPIFPHIYWLKLIDVDGPFSEYRDEHDYFSSTALLQSLGAYFTNRPQFRTTVNGDALTVQFPGESWSVRLIPTIPVNDQQGRPLYDLVPDGRGNWQRSPERSRLAQLKAVNERYQGQVLPLIRLLQFWRQHNQLKIEAGDWEALIVQVLGQQKEGFTGLSAGLASFFRGMSAITLSVEEPELVARCAAVLERVEPALVHESQGQVSEALTLWQRVFGATFLGLEELD